MDNITKTIILALVCMLLLSTPAAAVGRPIADFAWTETSVSTPLTVNFTDTSYTYNERAPTSWFWDFGDGATSTEQNPTHVYTTTGTYQVRFTATNSAGSHTQIRDIVVLALDFTADKTSGAAPLVVHFTPHIVGIPSWNYYNMAWGFGDRYGNNIGSTHKYYFAGSYDVSMAIHSSDGISSYVLKKPAYITIDDLPAAKFDYEVNDLSVKFTDQSNNKPTSWSWNFGDGKTSADQNPTHVYENTGTYNVTLTATNSAGSNSISTDINVVNTDVADVPEFSSIALPAVVVLGLVAVFGRKKE